MPTSKARSYTGCNLKTIKIIVGCTSRNLHITKEIRYTLEIISLLFCLLSLYKNICPISTVRTLFLDGMKLQLIFHEKNKNNMNKHLTNAWQCIVCMPNNMYNKFTGTYNIDSI